MRQGPTTLSSSRLARIRVRTLTLTAGVFILATLLPGVPVAWSAPGDEVVNEIEIVPPPPPPPVLPDQEREPG